MTATNRFKVSIVDMGDSFGVLVYDLKLREVIGCINDYADLLIEKLHLKRESIAHEVGHLKVFWSYLCTRAIKLSDVDDSVIKAFVAASIRSAKSSPSHRVGNVDNVSHTINAKIVRVYDWIKWLQETNRISHESIGPLNALVTSALLGSSLSSHMSKNRQIRAVDRYPLLLEVILKGDLNKVPKFIPTEDTVDSLHEHFFSAGGSLHARHRNALLVDIASGTGFRRNSIQSLHISQFVGDDYIETDRDTIIIRPSRQKFNYGDFFEIPFVLHQQVRNFILKYRAPHLKRKNLGESTSLGAVFISDTRCTPLDDRSITALMSKALRQHGAPKGTAIHSFRAKFLVEATADEYRDRQELNLDTSAQTIMIAVSSKAGQKNPNSVRPYTHGHDASMLVKLHASRARKISTLEEENNSLRNAIFELEKKLTKRNI